MSTSFQLPDLLTLTSSFELRVNPWCHRVTVASEQWMLGILEPEEFATLPSMKIGLLASLCFPSCDAPQLRLLTDFLTLLLYSNFRVLYRNHDVQESEGWPTNETEELSAEDSEVWSTLLVSHPLFKQLVPQITHIAAKSSTRWETQFTKSVHSYCSALRQIKKHQAEDIIPSLEDYILILRATSGFDMIFDMFILVEGYVMPDVVPDVQIKLESLKIAVADIIAWSLDIFSYNTDQSRGNQHNLITVLMAGKGLSVQGAVNLASKMIKDKFVAFHSTEQSLFEAPHPSSWPTLSWLWGTGTASQSSDDATTQQALEDLKSYTTWLKDRIIGTINWAYETELYFRKRGEEIRTFGWVFLNARP